MNNEQKWYKMYEIAKKYYLEHGNLCPKVTYVTEEGVNLGSWLHNQRRGYKNQGTTKVTPEKIELLEKIGMVWDVSDYRWNVMYDSAKEYYEKYGNLKISVTSTDPDDIKLRHWLQSQKTSYTSNKLDDKKVKMLESINIDWNPGDNDKRWNKYYLECKKFQKQFKHLNIPRWYVTENDLRLGEWINRQRVMYQANNPYLTEERISLLENLGMIWQINQKKWDDNFDELKRYYEENNTNKIDKDYVTDSGLNLALWLEMQKRKYLDNKLNDEQVNRLNSINVDWNKKR